MAYTNGLYDAPRRQPQPGRYSSARGLSDLGNCGCQTSDSAPAAAGGFDFSSVPMIVWIGAAVIGGLLILKKK